MSNGRNDCKAYDMNRPAPSQYYGIAELGALGFRRVGRNVMVHRSTIIARPETISIGDDCRIDGFCVIIGSEAGIRIGRHVHIASGVYIFGGGGVEIEDFVGLSSRVVVYSTNDDYSGSFLTGPTIPPDFTKITAERVVIRRHVVVGAGSVILPGVTIGTGSAIGALSLVKRDVEEFKIAGGNPLRVIKSRKCDLLDLETRLDEREKLSKAER